MTNSIQLDDDFLFFFNGYADNRYILYGLTDEGQVEEVFDPIDQLVHDPRLGEFNRALDLGSYVTVVGNELVFPYVVNTADGNSAAAIPITILASISSHGLIEYLGELPTGWAPYGFGAASAISETPQAATAHNGEWFGPVGTISGLLQMYAVDDTGQSRQATFFATPPASAASGFIETSVSVGTDLYLVSDQRFARGNNELYRILDTGVTELVFESLGTSVYDLESFAGYAWFTTWAPSGTFGFFRADAEGVQELAFPEWQDGSIDTRLLLTDVEGRLFIYGRGFIGEVQSDGSVQTLMDVSFVSVDGITLFDNTIYFYEGNMRQLMRLGANGIPTPIPRPEDAAASFAISELTEIDGSLYFWATAERTGTFGEPIGYWALYRLEVDGSMVRLTGPDTSAPEIYGNGAIHDFSVDFVPVPVPTSGPDILIGTSGNDTIAGLGGNDTIDGEAGNDSIDGGAGFDSVTGGTGDDHIDGGVNADTLIGNGGNDTLLGGFGFDQLFGGFGNDDLYGGGDNDTLYGFEGFDRLFGEQGNDLLYGEGGNDALFGGQGNDRLFGGNGNDFLAGFIGDDTLYGEQGNDVINAGDGNDRVFAGTGDDQVFGGNGNDVVFGWLGNDRIFGQQGNDTIFGEAGNDLLDGGGGNDVLNGGAGQDRLFGWGGDDLMTGGADADVFVFANGGGRDTITDFQTGVAGEVIDLSRVGSITTMAQLNAAAVDTAAGVLITLSAGNTILLQGLLESQLSADDFIFT